VQKDLINEIESRQAKLHGVTIKEWRKKRKEDNITEIIPVPISPTDNIEDENTREIQVSNEMVNSQVGNDTEVSIDQIKRAITNWKEAQPKNARLKRRVADYMISVLDAPEHHQGASFKPVAVAKKLNSSPKEIRRICKEMSNDINFLV